MIDYTCPAKIEAEVYFRSNKLKHALAGYVKDSKKGRLMQVKNWNLLSVQKNLNTKIIRE